MPPLLTLIAPVPPKVDPATRPTILTCCDTTVPSLMSTLAPAVADSYGSGSKFTSASNTDVARADWVISDRNVPGCRYLPTVFDDEQGRPRHCVADTDTIVAGASLGCVNVP